MNPSPKARLQAYFEQEGYHVSVTASATGLREIMSQHPVDLILLDINLPDENGLMLTRALRERSTVGIILVTGRSDQIDRIVGPEMGADDYVTKPLELRELVVRVKNLLWRIDLARRAQPETKDNCYQFAGYCLNVSRHTQSWAMRRSNSPAPSMKCWSPLSPIRGNSQPRTFTAYAFGTTGRQSRLTHRGCIDPPFAP